MSEFLFQVGDVAAHKATVGGGARHEKRGVVVQRNAETCHGGTQRSYHVAHVCRDEFVTGVVNESALVAATGETAADLLSRVKELAIDWQDYELAVAVRELHDRVVRNLAQAATAAPPPAGG